jgi:hypothetical protein
MSRKILSILGGCATGFVMLSSMTAASASTFLLTFDQVGTPTNGCCGPFDVSATLQATADGGNYDITGITGTVTQNGTSFAITSLISAPNDPAGNFGFDNVIVANAGSAPFSFDTGGIGFYVAGITQLGTPADPFTAFNIFDNGNPSGILSTSASNDVNTEFNGTYSITEVAAVPEPSTWAMMILGFCGLGFMASRRRGPARRFA